MSTVLVALILSFTSFGFIYEGTLLDAEGNPLAEPNVDLRVDVLEESGTCILYSRLVSVDLSSSQGRFSVDIATAGTKPTGEPHENTTLSQALSNVIDHSLVCSDSNPDNFTGTFSRRRVRLTITSINGIDISDISLPAQFVSPSVYAEESQIARAVPDGSITDAKVASGIDAAKLTGSLPAIDGSALLGVTATGGIGADAISDTQLADGSVDTAAIQNSAVTNDKISDMTIDKLMSAAAAYFTYAPSNTQCNDGEVLKWTAADRWECAADENSNTLASMSGTSDNIAQGSTNLFMTIAERDKLTNIALGAEVNVQADWNAGSGDAQILNKPSIPSDISDLTLGNDSISGDSVDGGMISDFQSTGIDDNSSSTSMTLNNSGHLGIGTTSPESILHTSTAFHTPQKITIGADRGGDGTIAAIELQRNNYDPVGRAAAIRFERLGGAYDAAIAFDTNNSGSAGNQPTERMRITRNGNIGIGTASPLSKLEIFASGDNSADGYDGHIKMRTTESHQWIQRIDTSGALHFDANNGASISNIMKFERVGNALISGNVGIGSTSSSPSRKLDIVAEGDGFYGIGVRRSGAPSRVIEVGVEGTGTAGRALIKSSSTDLDFEAGYRSSFMAGGGGWGSAYTFNQTNPFNGGSGAGHTGFAHDSQLVTNSGTGSFTGAEFRSTVNQTGTASGDYTAFKINATETAFLGADSRLFDVVKNGQSQLTIHSDGKVGIGSSSAESKLHVVANPSAQGLKIEAADASPMEAIQVEGANNGSVVLECINCDNHPKIKLVTVANGNGGRLVLGNSIETWLITAKDDNLLIQEEGGIVRLAIAENGNVGIGTASSSYPLEVNGVIHSSTGGFRLPDGTVVDEAADLGGGSGVPSGAVMAFNLASCPSGWSEYTPARGRFIRGIDNGAGVDPDGTRALGNIQGDAAPNIQGTANGILGNNVTSNGSGALNWNYTGTAVPAGTTRGKGNLVFDASTSSSVYGAASEVRPENVSLLYCEKD